MLYFELIWARCWSNWLIYFLERENKFQVQVIFLIFFISHEWLWASSILRSISNKIHIIFFISFKVIYMCLRCRNIITRVSFISFVVVCELYYIIIIKKIYYLVHILYKNSLISLTILKNILKYLRDVKKNLVISSSISFNC